MIHFEDVVFRVCFRDHGNCKFLGYADGTVVAEDLRLRIRGLQVKILNGKPRIDFLFEKAPNGVLYPICFPKSAETREALTQSLFEHPQISEMIEEDTEYQRVAADIPF